MKILIIIVGIIFLLGWLFLYKKYFSRQEKSVEKLMPTPGDKEGKIFSVAPWGDDSNDGCQTNPWKTLQYGVSNLVPGDRLLVRGGIYNEYISFKKSGSKENPIIVSASPGEEVVLDGGGIGWKYGINFEHGVAFVNISGFKVKNFHGAGVALWGDNNSVKCHDLEVFGCGSGAQVISASDLFIEDCYFRNNSGPGFVVSPGPLITAKIIKTRSSNNDSPKLPDGFTLDSGENIMLEKCTVEYNSGNGFSCSTSNTTFNSCIIRDNGIHGIKCSGNSYRVINCIIDSNGMAGIALHGGEDINLCNNLIVNCGIKGDYGLIAAPLSAAISTRLTIINNIFAFNYGGVHFGNAALVEKEDNNIYWSRPDAEISTSNRKYSRDEINGRIWFKETDRGEYSFCKDPLFIDIISRDYRLAKNSPAIDRGTKNCAPEDDINGHIRPQGQYYDIGPYEAAEGSIIPPTAKVVYCPTYSTDTSSSLYFTVRWDADNEVNEVGGFNVQVREGAWGGWQNWLTETGARESNYLGVCGQVYYFRVRAKDDLGNWGKWSDNASTVIPLDDQSPLIKYDGTWEVVNDEGAFLNTLHYSSVVGTTASFRFTGKEIAWISNLGPDRGQALVYIDDILRETVDLFSPDCQMRRSVFKTFSDGNPHTIRIEVANTKNAQSSGYRVDIDGIAVKL
ncbi:hypothetical protein SPSYN_00686 [Sporotomaculum syntrophicum]|uniref:Right handed beta helix domain-containing protein n=1 Tax=Sporotomaculum syntrophicum TaxID=182264 RepID=A0A9D3AZI9_9FIRM|nr:right-handed parallel beta-helix repeat-containing protein [Sporotomaculum syntrophicum]KAF1085949.1 hypothetical protein SPSYN_00686 [Sporotomaculum syntrophicum]